jgi:hypothetical protein
MFTNIKRIARTAALTALLAALPFTVTIGAEAGGSFKVGSFVQSGSTPAFALTFGSELIVTSDTAKNLMVTGYTGVFHANTSDQIEGATAITYLRKHFQAADWLRLDIATGSGVLYDVKEGDNTVAPAFALETTATIYQWIAAGAGVVYVWQTGRDQAFLYFSLNLLPLQ